MKRFYVVLGLASIFAGFLILLRGSGPEVEDVKKVEIVHQEVSKEESREELRLRKQVYYGIQVLADEENQDLRKKGLELMKEKTPEFFGLVIHHVKEIRQSESLFPMRPVKCVQGKDRIEFRDFTGRYTEYNVADFLVHEATHIVDQHNGLPYTKEAEIRAREKEIAFFRALERAEFRSFTDVIELIENEMDMIRKGRLYQELP